MKINNIAYVFPGQGSQKIGMCKDFYDKYQLVRETIELVEDSMKLSLVPIIFGEDQALLTKTRNAQPSLFGLSFGIWRVIIDQFGEDLIKSSTKALAGHSLGEYTAITAGKILSLEEAIKLLDVRSSSMQKAAESSSGKMAAIMGMEEDQIKKIIQDTPYEGICVIANNNAPGQIVISGDASAVEAVSQAVVNEGKRAIMLEVSAPFHSPLMKEAAANISKLAIELNFRDPIIPVISNVTAIPEGGNKWGYLLTEQVCGMVNWKGGVATMRDNLRVGTVIEVGPGKVLTNINKRIDPEMRAFNVSEPQDLDELHKILQGLIAA